MREIHSFRQLKFQLGIWEPPESTIEAPCRKTRSLPHAGQLAIRPQPPRDRLPANSNWHDDCWIRKRTSRQRHHQNHLPLKWCAQWSFCTGVRSPWSIPQVSKVYQCWLRWTKGLPNHLKWPTKKWSLAPVPHTVTQPQALSDKSHLDWILSCLGPYL